MVSYRYSLMQVGMKVASVEASTDEQARAEIAHYAMMYAQDGPVKIVADRRNPRDPAP